MRALVTLAGVTLNKRIALRRTQSRDQKNKKTTWTKATTTKLVNNMFETFFSDQIATNNDKEISVCNENINIKQYFNIVNIMYYYRVRKDIDVEYVKLVSSQIVEFVQLVKI